MDDVRDAQAGSTTRRAESGQGRLRPRQPEEIIEHDGSLSDEIYEELLSRIFLSEIRADGRITVDALSREFGVSQTPIREALHRLEADGIAIRSPYSGYRVAPLLDKAQFEQLVEVRLLLEPAAARLAAENANAGEILEMRAYLHQMSDPVLRDSRDRGYALFAQIDSKLHDVIAASGGNGFIRDSLARFHTHTHLFRLSNTADVTRSAIDEHSQIVEAVSRHDGAAAAEAMTRHIRASAGRFRKAFIEAESSRE